MDDIRNAKTEELKRVRAEGLNEGLEIAACIVERHTPGASGGDEQAIRAKKITLTAEITEEVLWMTILFKTSS